VNETRDTTHIEQLYTSITENEDNKVWKSGNCPEALGDSPLATDLKPNEPCSTADSECVTGGKAITPEDSDEENLYYLNKISERLKENQKKPGKRVNEQINNSENMSDKPDNIFDKLYSTIMEGDDPFADLEPGLPGDDDMLGDDDELDIGGDEITISLPRELAEKLHEALMEQLEDSEDGEGLDDFDDEADDEMLGDAVVSQPEPKPLGGHGDREHPMAGNKASNKVKSSKTNKGDGGTANPSTPGVKGDETPKPLGGHGDREHPMAGNKASNKVNNNSKAIGD
jgi:hypothetical protein